LKFGHLGNGVTNIFLYRSTDFFEEFSAVFWGKYMLNRNPSDFMGNSMNRRYCIADYYCEKVCENLMPSTRLDFGAFPQLSDE